MAVTPTPRTAVAEIHRTGLLVCKLLEVAPTMPPRLTAPPTGRTK